MDSQRLLINQDGLIEQQVCGITNGWIYPIVYTYKPIAIGNSNRGHNYWNIASATTTRVTFYQDSSGGTWDVFVKGF